MATCSTCGGAMLTERPHRHPVSDATPDLAAAMEAVEAVPSEALAYPMGPDKRWLVTHEEGCAYAYGNTTYPCLCYVSREAVLNALRAALASEPVPATGNPAPDVWSSDLPPGGYVCGVCGQPTESEPCPDHQAATPDLALYDLPALASEPVPATPACICGRAVPVAGTCFDIDGAYWSGHGEPVPATGNPEGIDG